MDNTQKKTPIKKFCQRFQIRINKIVSYNNVKGRLGYRFYSEELLSARERFKHADL